MTENIEQFLPDVIYPRMPEPIDMYEDIEQEFGFWGKVALVAVFGIATVVALGIAKD